MFKDKVFNALTVVSPGGVIGNSLNKADLGLLCRLNRLGDNAGTRRLFIVVSRLGNGIIWYTLVFILMLLGYISVAVHMLITAGIALLIYRSLKTKTARPRPYQCLSHIDCHSNVLDQFSFPSGHTLHAVNFTLVAGSYFPVLGFALLPMVALIALSRCILGLHYPSDVLAGGLIGCSVAYGSLILVGMI